MLSKNHSHRIVFHFGLDKTATTSMQESLFSTHSGIFYLGKARGYKAQRGCRTEHVFNVLKPIFFKIDGDFDPEACYTIFRENILPSVSDDQVIVGSWEGIGCTRSKNLFAEKIIRLKKVFGDFKLLMVIRNPYTRLPSLYLQDLKGHFVKLHRAYIGKRPYLSFDDWLSRIISCEERNDPFAYGRNIEHALRILGKQNVGVYMYEDLVDDPLDYYKKIFAFVGIKHDGISDKILSARLNKRLMQSQLNLIKETDRSIIRRLSWLLMGKKSRKKVFYSKEMQSDGEYRAAELEISKETMHRIAERSREANRWIMNEFNLDLYKRGYPI